MSARDLSLYDLLVTNSHRFADRPALIVAETEETVTFAQLRESVDALALRLEARGLARGDRVAILALNRVALVELLFACFRLGLVAVPLNFRWQTAEVRRFLERAAPKAFFFDPELAEIAPDPEQVSGIELHAELGSGLALAEVAGDDRPEAEKPWVPSEHPACIIATAAVDTIPRGALLSHANFLAAGAQELAALRLGPDDRSLCALPLFHIAGLGHFLTFFQGGGANVLLPKFDAAAAADAIGRWGVTHVSDFPPVLSQLLDAAAESSADLSSLRWVTGLDSPETMQRLHDETEATFVTGFGQTETTGFVTLQNARERSGSAGRAVDLSRVRVVDEWDREVRPGEAGEIVVRGPLVFLGYDGQPEVTQYTFRNHWHHTGDLGRFDDEGRLTYVGRKPEKDLIKPGGENVYPAEVEAVLLQMDGVRAACVFGVADERWGEAIKAVLEVETGFEPDLEGVRSFVGERIARFKRPAHLEVVERLPRLDDGSLDREAVRRKHGALQ